jgi:hypothetical protein
MKWGAGFLTGQRPCLFHERNSRKDNDMISTPPTFGDPRLPEKFWNWVRVDPATGCWLWTAGKSRGYGNFTLPPLNGRRRSAKAHRFAYESLVGPVPQRLHLDHYRMNPGPRNAPCSRACVNPAHLEPVTPRENSLRGVSPFAMNARQTHCLRGHAFTESNTSYNGNGSRVCLTCKRARHRLRARVESAERRAAGLCTRCGKPTPPGPKGGARCEVCLADEVARARARRARG